MLGHRNPQSYKYSPLGVPLQRIDVFLDMDSGKNYFWVEHSAELAYPTRTAIKLILDNHSAHISKETKAWLAYQPAGRFEFTFTPKHGSWLNFVEGFFSKLARSVLRHIRVATKEEL
jgi:hypothetical protein